MQSSCGVHRASCVPSCSDIRILKLKLGVWHAFRNVTCLCVCFTCGRFRVWSSFSGYISSKHASRNNFKALCDCVVGIDTGMDSLGRALNPDIYVPLDRDLCRLRKVNVTLDEEAAHVERIRQLKKTRSGFKSVLTKKRSSPDRVVRVRALARGHCVVFLDKTLYSHSAPLHPGV